MNDSLSQSGGEECVEWMGWRVVGRPVGTAWEQMPGGHLELTQERFTWQQNFRAIRDVLTPYFYRFFID